MNRIVALVLAMLYIGTTSGMVMSVHYCMGKIASVEIDNFKEVCNKCGAKKQSDCCGTETKVVKLNETHNQSVFGYELKAPVVQPVAYNDYSFATNIYPGFGEAAQANAPPLLSPPLIYIKNCVFRI